MNTTGLTSRKNELSSFDPFNLNTFSKCCPCGVAANVLNCEIVVSEFELQSCYYVHFGSYILHWENQQLQASERV